MKIELIEQQINSFPPGRELDLVIKRSLFGGNLLLSRFLLPKYSTDNSLVKPVLDRTVQKLGLYQLTYIENYGIGSAENRVKGSPTIKQRVFYAYDGVANPWGWGETQALAACRFALKAILYRQMNILKGVWPK